MKDILKECPPNSHKHKAEETEKAREVEKVVYGNVKKRKKNEIQKFRSKYLAEDSNSPIGQIWNDMILPAARKMASDVVDNFFDFVRDSFDDRLYGGTKSHRSGSGSSYGYKRHTAYGEYFDRKRRDREPVVLRAKSGFDFDPIFFSTRGDAEAVLKELHRLIGKYKVVSVCDMYRAANMDCPYTYEKYGWMDISEGKVVRDYYENEPGYIIDLPRPMPID